MLRPLILLAKVFLFAPLRFPFPFQLLAIYFSHLWQVFCLITPSCLQCVQKIPTLLTSHSWLWLRLTPGCLAASVPHCWQLEVDVHEAEDGPYSWSCGCGCGCGWWQAGATTHEIKNAIKTVRVNGSNGCRSSPCCCSCHCCCCFCCCCRYTLLSSLSFAPISCAICLLLLPCYLPHRHTHTHTWHAIFGHCVYLCVCVCVTAPV